MLLNRAETLLMNNPVRSWVQRHVEARRLRSMGGTVQARRALEVGCGQGVGVEIILDVFGAARVDAFDLDPRMVARAEKRLANRNDQARFSVGDVTAIEAADGTYDAVFDFGIIHHVPDWQLALGEIHRVLKPGGRLFAEEVYEQFILHPLWRRVLDHPMNGRFDHRAFERALEGHGFEVRDSQELWGWFGWFVADKPSPAAR